MKTFSKFTLLVLIGLVFAGTTFAQKSDQSQEKNKTVLDKRAMPKEWTGTKREWEERVEQQKLDSKVMVYETAPLSELKDRTVGATRMELISTGQDLANKMNALSAKSNHCCTSGLCKVAGKEWSCNLTDNTILEQAENNPTFDLMSHIGDAVQLMNNRKDKSVSLFFLFPRGIQLQLLQISNFFY